MSRTKEQLLAASNQVKNETQQGANTADRIGGILYDISEHIGEGGGGGTSDDYLNATYSGQDKVPIATYKIGNNSSGTLYAPNGGGGGGSDDPRKIGTQISYYLNLTKGITPETPVVGDWNHETSSSNDQFIHATSIGNQVWKRIDENRLTTQDTWQIWVWFENNAPQYINGPVNMTAGGTNGADSNEKEFIYFRTAGELADDAITALSTYFAGCVGTAEAKDGKTFKNEDAIPKDTLGYSFTDQPQGIDDSDHKYEYEAYRDSTLNNNGARTWGTDCFHGPYLRSAYGKQGQDGDGVEYIFYADSDGSPSWGTGDYPPDWTNDEDFQDDEYRRQESRWMDNPVDIEKSPYKQGAKQWVSIRKYRDGRWQQYSVPSLWSYFAKDGVVNGYVTDFVNENMPVGVGDDGTVSGYTNQGRVQAFRNGDTLNYTDTVGSDGYPAEGFFTYTIGTITRSDDGRPAQGITAVKNSSDKAQVDVTANGVSNFVNVNAYIPITVKLPNKTEQMLECTLYGIQGVSGQAIDIWTNADVIRDNGTGQGTAPASLRIGVKIGKGDDVHVYYSEEYSGTPVQGSAEALGFFFGYAYDDDRMQPIKGSLNLQPNHSTITIEMHKGADFATGSFADSEDIPFVKNGATIVRTTPYYRAVATEAEKPGTPGHEDINTQDKTDPNETGWGENKPFLYRREYYTYSDGGGYWGDTCFYAKWLEGGDSSIYVISTINDNAVIDDQTTGKAALETATINPITVYRGTEDVTTSCNYKITSLQLPTGLKLQTKNGSTYTDISLNGETTVNTFVIAPDSPGATLQTGNYYYDVLVKEASKTKRFKLYIDENISLDGSFYNLSIQNDTISYDSDGNKISTTSPIVKAYRISNDGTSQQVNITVTTSVPQSASDTMYIVVDNVLNNAKSESSGTSITFSGSIPYSADGHDVTLYKGNQFADGPEHIDCIKNGRDGSGADGYSLVANPSYLIFDEPVSETGVTGSDGSVTYYAAELTQDKLAEQYAIVKVLKGKDPQVINYDTNSLTCTTCTAKITDEYGNTPSSNTTSLKVTVTHIPQKLGPTSEETGWNKTEGKIAFTVTVGGESFYRVEIPIYINRLGSRFQTIAGDVETTIMTKCTYKDENGNVVRGDTMGNYVRSSELNRQALTEKVNDIEINNSEIKQTSDSINMSVNNGWYNYIINPLAIEGRVGMVDSESIIEDLILGKVRQITKQVAGDWQLTHDLDTRFEELTGNIVTWFCIVKSISAYVDVRRVNFGSGYETGESSGKSHEAIKIIADEYGVITASSGLKNGNDGHSDYYDMGTLQCGQVNLGDGWYLCYTSIKLKSGRVINPGGKEPGFNTMVGTWQIYYAGIVKGAGYPTLSMIITGSGLKRAGIDIKNGIVDLKANKTNFSYYDEQAEEWKSDKIWIDNTTGTLHAVDGEFTGIVHSRQGDFDQLLSVDGKVGVTGTSISNHHWRGIAVGLNPLMKPVSGDSPTNRDYATFGARFTDNTSDSGYGYAVLADSGGHNTITMKGDEGSVEAASFIGNTITYSGTSYQLSKKNYRLIITNIFDEEVTITLPNTNEVYQGQTYWIRRIHSGTTYIKDASGNTLLNFGKSNGWIQIVYAGEWIL